MKIKQYFDYYPEWDEMAKEFMANDSVYQAQTLNEIGDTFKRWTKNEEKTATHIQLLEIAEELDDDGRWFIKTLCDYMECKAESEDKE